MDYSRMALEGVESRNPKIGKAATKELWHDVDRNRYYLCVDGHMKETDKHGRPLRSFVPYCTGQASSLQRSRDFDFDSGSGSGSGPNSPSTSAAQSNPSRSNRPSQLPAIKETNVASIAHLSGYAQFPTPVSKAYFHTKRSSLGNGKSVLTPLPRAGLDKLLSPLNIEALMRQKALGNTCSFLTLKQCKGSETLSSSDGTQKQQAHRTKYHNILAARQNQVHHTKDTQSLGTMAHTLDANALLLHSTLKKTHLPALRATFQPFQSLRRIDESVSKLLSSQVFACNSVHDTEEDAIISGTSLFRSLEDIHKALKEEEQAQAKGSLAPPKAEYKKKGVFNVNPPTEADLYSKSIDWRRAVNPKAFEEEQRRERIDRMLLAKRKQQRELKARAMATFIRTKEKQQLKEHREVQAALLSQPPIPSAN